MNDCFWSCRSFYRDNISCSV